MGQIRTLKDVNTGEKIYPVTSSKAVIDEKGVDFDTKLQQQQSGLDNSLKDYVKTETMAAELGKKQDKIEGKGLSTNDFSNPLKDKLDGLPTNEELTETINKIASVGVPIVEQTETEVSIEPNVLNRWGEVTSLTIDFAKGKEGVINEYMMEFISGDTATSLSFPKEVKFVEEPIIDANMRYG